MNTQDFNGSKTIFGDILLDQLNSLFNHSGMGRGISTELFLHVDYAQYKTLAAADESAGAARAAGNQLVVIGVLIYKAFHVKRV